MITWLVFEMNPRRIAKQLLRAAGLDVLDALLEKTPAMAVVELEPQQVGDYEIRDAGYPLPAYRPCGRVTPSEGRRPEQAPSSYG